MQKGERSANARSVTSLMGLEVLGGDKIVLVAKGPDAKEAIDKLSQLVAAGLGDEGYPAASAPATTTTSPRLLCRHRCPRNDDPNLLLGVAASSGLAVGQNLSTQAGRDRGRRGRARG